MCNLLYVNLELKKKSFTKNSVQFIAVSIDIWPLLSSIYCAEGLNLEAWGEQP